MELFDAHCDTVSRCYRDGGHLWEREGHLDIKRTKSFGRYGQFFALFCDDEDIERGKAFSQVYEEQYLLFCREVYACRDHLTFCKTGAQAEGAFSKGKAAAFLSVEGAELLSCSLDKLHEAWMRGVRAVNLTWNRANELSGSNCDFPERGLTPRGRAFVRRMEELGVLVDVSHLSDRGFWDVLLMAQKPVIASHSNSRAVWDCPRNLTDRQFTAIIENGGVAGLCMYEEFLGEDAGLSTVVAHLEHFLSLGGEKHVCIGGDWDGCAKLPRGVNGIEDMERLRELLLRRNYSETLISAIFHRNLMRIVNEVCTM